MLQSLSFMLVRCFVLKCFVRSRVYHPSYEKRLSGSNKVADWLLHIRSRQRPHVLERDLDLAWSKVHLVNGHHVVFKIHHTIQNQTLGLAHGMSTKYHLAKVLQMNLSSLKSILALCLVA
jgi:hypothetical protein